ncbi:MAG: DUF1800 domain-containing protein [Betaproteobacteria bacterium]
MRFRYSHPGAWLTAVLPALLLLVAAPGIAADAANSAGRTVAFVSLRAVGVSVPVLAGSTVLLRAEMRGIPAAASAQFREGTAILGTAAAAPWEFTVSGITEGRHVYQVQVNAGGGRHYTSGPVEVVAKASVSPPAAAADVSRLLMQATFGPTLADVTHARQIGIDGWLDEQFALPLTWSHVDYLQQVRSATGRDPQERHAYEAVWQNFLFGNDQLRARVAFALSEIIVISNVAPDQNTWALASWMDMLYRNAFGNYRRLLEDATLHPAMGYYLNMLGNDKENPAKGYRPNENYAREMQQLFSIGLVKLNPDGTPMRDAQNRTIPTYDQSVVEGFAQVFTGWNFSGNDATSNRQFYDPPYEIWVNPMVVWPARHSTGPKTLVDGVVLPAGQSPQKDMQDALDLIFNHPNVGPFIGRRLIQFLVTSNPSPAYVGRVAARFNDSGRGVRGDMTATIRAILTDPEARDLTLAAGPAFGKLREPVIRFTHLLRATGAKAANGRNSIWWLDSPEDGLGQSPLLAPSVFNFFSPFFTRPGPIAQAGMVAPEFQIHTETQVVGNGNLFARVLRDRGFGFSDEGRLALDLTPWMALSADANALVDRLSLVFTASALSPATRTILLKTINAIPATNKTNQTSRVNAALTLMMVAPDFVVQR